MLVHSLCNKTNQPNYQKTKRKQTYGAALATGLVTLIVALTLNLMPNAAHASGGAGGGGGGGVKILNFSGNWSGTISTSFGTGAFTMKIPSPSAA